MMYTRPSVPTPKINAKAKSTRSSEASIPEYSAKPPRTPPSIRFVLDRYNFFTTYAPPDGFTITDPVFVSANT